MMLATIQRFYLLVLLQVSFVSCQSQASDNSEVRVYAEKFFKSLIKSKNEKDLLLFFEKNDRCGTLAAKLATQRNHFFSMLIKRYGEDAISHLDMASPTSSVFIVRPLEKIDIKKIDIENYKESSWVLSYNDQIGLGKWYVYRDAKNKLIINLDRAIGDDKDALSKIFESQTKVYKEGINILTTSKSISLKDLAVKLKPYIEVAK